MPEFDIVNKLDLQEVDNAVNQTRRMITTRYDFRNSKSEINLNKKDHLITILTEDEMKMRALKEELIGNIVKRSIDPKVLSFQEIKPAAKAQFKMDVNLIEGIDTDTSRLIVKLIKDMKLKVQVKMQDQQVRVSGKKIDDLQAVIHMLKEKNLEIPLQFVNMKS
ncbi:MAG TPA: YajQ family cyclic di-GMP-binding protein [Thermoanaerobaculia bacterium]|nr:YajQ family cyclic di-GMP-binding protein [Thermoanaerobaculia bacterium]HUM29079.1 YajQ family cyclic di-GMP-binding protein [Thermoanaerobaculia bacterium]HXK67365.1 YajQ family cyclic di-GMP-binding protein [Thermoanaerobaculia bacterium]